MACHDAPSPPRIVLTTFVQSTVTDTASVEAGAAPAAAHVSNREKQV